jgi:protocatechuate 3,4-dioxygenase beta subunit
MQRRTFLSLISTVPFVLGRDAEAQDAEFLRALDAAQAERPATLENVARIAPRAEPGLPLVIHGRVLDAGGTAAANAIVFAYHTDREGLYDRPGRGGHSWRLRGWARTDADGRYEFQTIRPAEYPSRTIPAHVHVNIYTPAGRYSAGELRFLDDSLVRDSERRQSQEAGEFGWVRPVTLRDGVQHVDFVVRLAETRKF